MRIDSAPLPPLSGAALPPEGLSLGAQGDALRAALMGGRPGPLTAALAPFLRPDEDLRPAALGEAIADAAEITPELLAPFMMAPARGLIPGTLAALGRRGRLEDAARILAWMSQREGPFEDLTPQAALVGAHGLLALGEALDRPLPEGIWEATLTRLWGALDFDPARPHLLALTGALALLPGGCGGWIRASLKRALFAGLQHPPALRPRTLALMAALLPSTRAHTQGLETLKAQLPAPAQWMQLLVEAQALTRAPSPWLAAELRACPIPPAGPWGDLHLLARSTASPEDAPLPEIAACLRGGRIPLFEACAAALPAPSDPLVAAAQAALDAPDDPGGPAALALMTRWGLAPLLPPANHRAALSLGYGPALAPLLRMLDAPLPEAPGPRANAQALAALIGEGAARHPDVGAELLARAEAAPPGPGLALALDALAEALWAAQHRAPSTPDWTDEAQGRLRALALPGVSFGGAPALRWGRILGWTGDGAPPLEDALLGLLARTPAAQRGALLEPLGALGRPRASTLGPLLHALDPDQGATALQALRGLARLAEAAPLGDAFLPVASALAALPPEAALTLEPAWTAALWHLAQGPLR